MPDGLQLLDQRQQLLSLRDLAWQRLGPQGTAMPWPRHRAQLPEGGPLPGSSRLCTIICCRLRPFRELRSGSALGCIWGPVRWQTFGRCHAGSKGGVQCCQFDEHQPHSIAVQLCKRQECLHGHRPSCKSDMGYNQLLAVCCWR